MNPEIAKIFKNDGENVELFKKLVFEAVMDALNQDRKMESDENLLTEEEAARYLQVQPQTLSSWRHQGKGPCYIKVGSRVRYERLELEAYAQGNRVKTLY